MSRVPGTTRRMRGAPAFGSDWWARPRPSRRRDWAGPRCEAREQVRVPGAGVRRAGAPAGSRLRVLPADVGHLDPLEVGSRLRAQLRVAVGAPAPDRSD